MADLLASGVPCDISAVPSTHVDAPLLAVGMPYGPAAAEQAKKVGWDAFGENGEFHSVAKPWLAARAAKDTDKPTSKNAAMGPAVTSPRVASMLPSATEIVGHLGLQHLLVGVSHSCNLAPRKEDLDLLISEGKCVVLTSTGIDKSKSQGEINASVVGSVSKGFSLYNILDSEFRAAKPAIVLAQDLCDVCAPTVKQVSSVAETCEVVPGAEGVKVVNLEPHDLRAVADTFVIVSEALTSSRSAGEKLAQCFWEKVERVKRAVSLRADAKNGRGKPRCVMLEWVDPMYVGGNWIPDMLVAAGGDRGLTSAGAKSRFLEPSALVEFDPDCVVIACCGFDLPRNVQDAQMLWSNSWWPSLRCVREGCVFVADADYFARPSPSLTGGTAILARCMYDGDTSVREALEATGVLPPAEAWTRLTPPTNGRVA